MSAAALSVAAVLALATDPRCGAAPAQGDMAGRLAAIASHESERRPYAIGINRDDRRGLPADRIFAASAQEAANSARALLAAGRSIDLGLMQISHRNLDRHGLTVETAFDPCQSMRAGAQHFAADLRAAYGMAHRRYNCGGFECGGAYAASVEAAYQQITTGLSAAPVAAPPAVEPSAPPRITLSTGRTVPGRTMTYGRKENPTP